MRLTLYPIGGRSLDRGERFAKTDEFRPPRKGEWFLSGAIPEAYQAVNNMTDKRCILVQLR